MQTYLALAAIIVAVVVPAVHALGKAAFGQPRAWSRIKRHGLFFFVFMCGSFAMASGGLYLGRFGEPHAVVVGTIIYVAISVTAGFFAVVIWLFDQLKGGD